jgi:hypothetical protein
MRREAEINACYARQKQLGLIHAGQKQLGLIAESRTKQMAMNT